MTNILEVELGIVAISPDYFLIELSKRERRNTFFVATKSKENIIMVNDKIIK
jgi:hypothetical protein